jgi:hypothetical protein
MKLMRLIRSGSAAALIVGLNTMDSQATSFPSTQLADLAELADAVIQGTVTRVESRLDAKGVPWTLYTMSVDSMLVGEADSELIFRCIGGPLPQDRLLQMVGAPVIELGESLVFLHRPGGICDVSGFENGMFWVRQNAAGEARLVNHEGFAIAGFDADGEIVSDEVVLSARQLAAAAGSVPSQDQEAPIGANGAAIDNSLPPAAELQPILDELSAFAATYVTRPKRIVSVNGVADVPALAPGLVSGGKP